MVLLIRRLKEQRRRAHDAISGFGQRFERSLPGEALISGLVFVLILIGVVWNLPDSHVKRALIPTLNPIAAASGLQQSWSMYAPEPVPALETVLVRVTMADDSERVWTWQRGDRIIGHLSWYRWHKLKEQSVRQPASRPGLARWVVGELTSPVEQPVRVQMIFRNEMLPLPGQDGPRTVTDETLFDETLTPG